MKMISKIVNGTNYKLNNEIILMMKNRIYTFLFKNFRLMDYYEKIIDYEMRRERDQFSLTYLDLLMFVRGTYPTLSIAAWSTNNSITSVNSLLRNESKGKYC